MKIFVHSERQKYYFFALFMVCAFFCNSQVNRSFFDLIPDEEEENIVIQANFQDLFAEKYKDIKAKGTIKVNSVESQAQSFDVDIELRGKYRRVKCDFPPMKLTFKKKDAKIRNLDEKYRSIRVVTHCYVDEKNSTDHLLREYLAYKMYDKISPLGFRVKKVHIEYRDSLNNLSQEYVALLIEDNDQLAYRIGAYECEGMYNLEEASFNEKNYLLVNAFQFMIANSDWSKDILKNIKVLKRGNEFLLVPYDFDFSALVNSKMALPNNNIGLFRLKDRCWMGPDLKSNKILLDYFKPLKSDFLDLIDEEKGLSRTSKNYMKQIIESFYAILDGSPLQNKVIYEFSNFAAD